MKKLLVLAGLGAAFFGHAQWAFSESRALRWIEGHERAVFDMKDGVCKHFTYDVSVDIRAKTPKGEWQVEGGKEQVCDYVRAANAHVRVLKPALNTHTELLSVDRTGFPWMSATVKVRQSTSFDIPKLRTVTEVSETTYVLRRGLRSLQIAELTVRSEGGFPR